MQRYPAGANGRFMIDWHMELAVLQLTGMVSSKPELRPPSWWTWTHGGVRDFLQCTLRGRLQLLETCSTLACARPAETGLPEGHMGGLQGPVTAHLALRQEHPDPSNSSTECSADSSSSERSTVSYRLRLRVTPAGQADPDAEKLSCSASTLHGCISKR